MGVKADSNKIIAYKKAGITAKDAARMTGLSLSTVQKIYARAKDVRKENSCAEKVRRAIDALLKNPFMKISTFNLSRSELVMLYRSKEWETQIKPRRVVHRLLTKPDANIDDILEKCSLDTMEALETLPEWRKVIKARQQFETARKEIKDLKKEKIETLKKLKICIPRYAFENMAIMDLREKIDELPDDAKVVDKKANKIAQLYVDLEYIQLKNEISLLENKADKIYSIKFTNLFDNLTDEAKALIIKHIGGMNIKREPIPVQKRIGDIGIDISVLIEKMDEERWNKYFVIYNDEIWDRAEFEARTTL